MFYMKPRSFCPILYLFCLLMLICVGILFVSCRFGEGDDTPPAVTGKIGDETQEEETTLSEIDMLPEVFATFDGTDCTVSNPDALSWNDRRLVVTTPCQLSLSGTLDDVRVDKTEKVKLILNNLTATCQDSGVIYVESADKVVIDLPKDSQNILTDAKTYVYADGETKPNACIYSSDDLTIRGEGELIVNGNYNNAIGSKNDIDIKGGVLTLSAVKNAVKGNDSVTVRENAVVTVVTANDGLKADNDTDIGKGYVKITDSAQVSIFCLDDAIQATQGVTIDCQDNVIVSCGGKYINCSAKNNITGADKITQK